MALIKIDSKKNMINNLPKGRILLTKNGTSKKLLKKIKERYDKNGYKIIFIFPSNNKTEKEIKTNAIENKKGG